MAPRGMQSGRQVRPRGPLAWILPPGFSRRRGSFLVPHALLSSCTCHLHVLGSMLSVPRFFLVRTPLPHV